MTNVKNYLLQNRIHIPMLLLSMLIMTPWTQSERIKLPSFIRLVALIKNFHHPHLIPDDDHKPSDYWWDDPKLPLWHSNFTLLFSTATPLFLSNPPTPESTCIKISTCFPSIADDTAKGLHTVGIRRTNLSFFITLL